MVFSNKEYSLEECIFVLHEECCFASEPRGPLFMVTKVLAD